MSLTYHRHWVASQRARLPELKHSFTGQTIIVTGSNIGLGFEAAKHYVRLGAERVILAVRSVTKGNEAKERIEAATGRPGVCEVWTLDMSSNASIMEFSKKAESLNRLDVLLANAGVITNGSELSVDGVEMMMAVNVYGTILLALLLIPIMRRSGKQHNNLPVITIVSSEAHHYTQLEEETKSGDILAHLADEQKVDVFKRYQITKILELFYVRELAKHINIDKSGVVVNTANPGLCYSAVDRNMPLQLKIMMTILRGLLARSTEAGARTLVWPTTAGAEGHGKYSVDLTFSDDAVSRFVRGEDGARHQKEIYDAINGKLEKVRAGVVEAALAS